MGVMAENLQNWFVLVEQQTFGPYSTAQMEGFVREGRIIGESVITHNLDQGFYRASAYPIYAKWQAETQKAPIATATVTQIGQQQLGHSMQVAVGQTHTQPNNPYEIQHVDIHANQTRTSNSPQTQLKPSVFLIMAEIQSGQAMRFLQRLQTLGTAQRIGDTVWLLRSPTTADSLRSALSQTLTKSDRLFILDSNRNEKAWFNIGADMGNRINDLWDSQE